MKSMLKKHRKEPVFFTKIPEFTILKGLEYQLFEEKNKQEFH